MGKSKVTIQMGNSYKLGMNEVLGLRNAISEAFSPLCNAIKDKAYWSSVALEDVEYMDRDGFIPHSHNCGGLRINLVIPKCESYEFDFLEFGECDECGDTEKYPEGDHRCGYEGQECAYESEGHLDAALRIWFKFEGYDKETGDLNFYLVMSGGNRDAPYFREQHLATIFEASFSCKSVEGLKRAAAPHIKKLLKAVQGE